MPTIFIEGFVDVRHHLLHGVRAGLFCQLRALNRLASVVAAGAGDNLDLAPGLFNRNRNHPVRFRVVQGGRFSGRADGDDPPDDLVNGAGARIP